MNVVRACENWLDFFTIDDNTTDLHIHNLGLELEGNILQSPALAVSAATPQKTFGLIDLTSTYCVRTRRVLGDIEHRTQAFRSGVRCCNH
ncbi:hypothetical protein TNCV_2603111 [Trichonephila clavipes]|nr:hypothetical protein TNCV_2603111 [Trichonephila clavipes]